MGSDRTDWYVLPLNPEPWRVGPLSVGRGTRGNPYPIIGRNQQLANYQEAVREELIRQRATMIELLDPDYGYELTFFFHHVLEQYQTATGRKAKDKPADLTNLVKATEDALQGVVISNDSLVAKQTNYVSRSCQTDDTPYLIVGVAPYLGHDPGELPAEVWEGLDIMLANLRAIPPAVVQLPEQDVF